MSEVWMNGIHIFRTVAEEKAYEFGLGERKRLKDNRKSMRKFLKSRASKDMWLYFDDENAQCFIDTIAAMPRHLIVMNLDALQEQYLPGITQVVTSLKDELAKRTSAGVSLEEQKGQQ